MHCEERIKLVAWVTRNELGNSPRNANEENEPGNSTRDASEMNPSSLYVEMVNVLSERDK